MQAIVETVFDAVYLVSVITIGILMIRGCKGSHQFKLFGLMAVVLGAGDSFHLDVYKRQINDRAVRHGVSTSETHRERLAVQWHLPLRR